MIVGFMPRQDEVVIGNGPDTLAQITRPGVHLAIWRRTLPASLAMLAACDPAYTDDIDAEVAVAHGGPQIGALLDEAGYGSSTAAVAELSSLIATFAQVMTCAMVRLRLEVIETDACRRFHADHVTARLLLTLAGRGTQWIRAGEMQQVSQLDPGDVALFKGRRWVEEPAILHRSPPIAGTGARRLLFVVDPVPMAVARGG